MTALTPAQRRALIPTTLRKKLCERTGRRDICDFPEESNSIHDDEYSKWSICKYHPEMQFCRWDPSTNPGIPQVIVDPETTTMPWKSERTPFMSGTGIASNTVDPNKSRYDGKLSNEHEVGTAASHSDDSPEDEEFGENIMDMKGDVFG
ncbi:unnamed protein product [Strongylus vulgaris]|uniref:Uncharacterized protein n=1 Tax=Strongylus vulgaris TaxID=40348 RepID=A0A3P7LBT5_STRVU|nr:unnamed protein product [Strongylus vulgaris]